MTESEAIKNINALNAICMNKEFYDVDFYLALSLAVGALEKVQQYEAIGTVGEVKALKDDFWKLNEMCREYSALGTVEEFKAIKQWKSDIIESFSKYDVNSVDELMKRFRELTEKAEPKKAIGEKYIEAYCPTCKEVISDGEFWLLDEYVHHCNNCGQAVMYVDWE